VILLGHEYKFETGGPNKAIVNSCGHLNLGVKMLLFLAKTIVIRLVILNWSV